MEQYIISDDKTRLDIDVIHDYLCNRSYWADGREREVVERSIENSLCFGAYEGDRQIGFARVVTDGATFAWLCDVFVVESHRGLGLGKRLVERAVAHPGLQELAIYLLATRDAHELYRRHGGFEPLDAPERWMIKRSRRNAARASRARGRS